MFGRLLLLALLATNFIGFAQSSPTWIQAAQIGGTGNERATSITTDTFGNTVAVGFFEGTIQLGSISLSCPAGSYRNLYVVKYSPQGAVLWAQRAGDGGAAISFATSSTSVTTDYLGNVYVAGSYLGTVTFGSTTLVGFAAGATAFLVKFSPTGIPLWARSARSPSGSTSSEVTTDIQGNVFLAGSYGGTATFGTVSLTSQGNLDNFIAKYDALGAIQWVQSIGGTDTDLSYGAKCDAQGNIYTCGSFGSTVALGATALVSSGQSDGFLVKYSPQGVLLWARSFGGTGSDTGLSIATDVLNNVYVGGIFSNVAIFGPTAALIGMGGNDGFLMQYNDAGTVQWVSQIGGAGNDELTDITSPSAGIVYATGSFTGSAAIGPHNLVSAGGADMWIARFNGLGTPIWASRGGGNQDEYTTGIASAGNGMLFLTLSFAGTTQFGISTATSRGLFDALVLQAQDTTPLGNKLAVMPSWQVYPNPFSNELTLDVSHFTAPVFIRLIDANGRQVLQDNFVPSIGLKTYTFPLQESIVPGVYYLQVKSGDNSIATRRLIKLL
ncbi:T9SS type A sorting domain-containing protein [Siccationidurans soli]|uniref:T9SS type A sorting domain-containing protein n=2 Tax=Hymenobacter negativus TaxID=2795026 RepID=A0ABS3QF31_9BACT|nr:T9SS type A sorting domain-containing protein [Hymenobacter negativus]